MVPGCCGMRGRAGGAPGSCNPPPFPGDSRLFLLFEPLQMCGAAPVLEKSPLVWGESVRSSRGRC